MSQLPFFPSCRKILIFPHPHDARITALPAAARNLSSKKKTTDRPNLMLEATTMLTTNKQTVVGRPAPEHRSPHNLKPKETTTPQQKTAKRRRRRRRRSAAATAAAL
jgi:hypothetical protein